MKIEKLNSSKLDKSMEETLVIEESNGKNN